MPGLELHVAVHRGPQQHAGVGQLDAHARRARARIERRVDEHDLAGEGLVGIGDDAQFRLLAEMHEAELLLEHVGKNPHRGQVGDLEQHLAGHETHALHARLLQHHAARARAIGEQPPRLAFLLQRLQLLVGDFPVAQAPQHAVGEPLHHRLRLGSARRQVPGAAQGDQVLLLRRDEVRAVYLHQRLAARDRLAGGVDVQLLDPALEARRDLVEQPLVRLDGAHGAHGAAQLARLDRFAAHAEELHLVEADFHRSRRRVRLAAFVDG